MQGCGLRGVPCNTRHGDVCQTGQLSPPPPPVHPSSAVSKEGLPSPWNRSSIPLFQSHHRLVYRTAAASPWPLLAPTLPLSAVHTTHWPAQPHSKARPLLELPEAHIPPRSPQSPSSHRIPLDWPPVLPYPPSPRSLHTSPHGPGSACVSPEHSQGSPPCLSSTATDPVWPSSSSVPLPLSSLSLLLPRYSHCLCTAGVQISRIHSLLVPAPPPGHYQYLTAYWLCDLHPSA